MYCFDTFLWYDKEIAIFKEPMIIYKITNIINNKVYIGQTVGSLEERWSRHLSDKSGCLALKAAIKKYGKDNFIIEQVDQASDLNELNKKEGDWIVSMNSLSPNGYNLKVGGDQPRLSQETINKISSSLKGRKFSKEHIEKMSERMKNRIVSQETKDKLSKIFKGKTTWAKGKKFTQEHREKISLSHTGKIVSEETRQKLSDYFTGHKQSKETIEKRKQTCIEKGFVPNPPKPIKCVETGIIYKSIIEAAKQMNLINTLISKVLQGKRNHTGGYTFVYVEDKKDERI